MSEHSKRVSIMALAIFPLGEGRTELQVTVSYVDDSDKAQAWYQRLESLQQRGYTVCIEEDEG